jgi:hypothetical protein
MTVTQVERQWLWECLRAGWMGIHRAKTFGGE